MRTPYYTRCPHCKRRIPIHQLQDRAWQFCPKCGELFFYIRCLPPGDEVTLLHIAIKPKP